jgi:hypothetical protein
VLIAAEDPRMVFRVVVMPIPLDGGRMNECRLVLDTNVFVAAGFEPKSASARACSRRFRKDAVG